MHPSFALLQPRLISSRLTSRVRTSTAPHPTSRPANSSSSCSSLLSRRTYLPRLPLLIPFEPPVRAPNAFLSFCSSSIETEGVGGSSIVLPYQALLLQEKGMDMESDLDWEPSSISFPPLILLPRFMPFQLGWTIVIHDVPLTLLVLWLSSLPP